MSWWTPLFAPRSGARAARGASTWRNALPRHVDVRVRPFLDARSGNPVPSENGPSDSVRLWPCRKPDRSIPRRVGFVWGNGPTNRDRLRLGEGLARDITHILIVESPDSHWVRLVSRHWLRSGRRPHRPHLASFGESPCRRGIVTFRDSTHHNGPMGSFGQTVSRAISPVFSTHPAEIPIGFVWRHAIGFVWGELMSPGYRHFSGLNTSELVLACSEIRGPHRCNPAIWPPAIFMGPGDLPRS